MESPAGWVTIHLLVLSVQSQHVLHSSYEVMGNKCVCGWSGTCSLQIPIDGGGGIIGAANWLAASEAETGGGGAWGFCPCTKDLGGAQLGGDHTSLVPLCAVTVCASLVLFNRYYPDFFKSLFSF